MTPSEPDLILLDGKIVTLDDDSCIVGALAAKDGRIVALGEDRDIEALAGPGTKVLCLDGKTVIPGIIDSHCHPDGAASRVINWHDLSPSRIQSRDALLARIDDATKDLDVGGWFFGYRLNENNSARLAQPGGVGRGIQRHAALHPAHRRASGIGEFRRLRRAWHQ